MALTIGDFARLGGVSTRMLRHYDGIGLLRPERVDEWSGYRYYAASQLTRLNRLIAFRDLGFGLDEIAELLDADPESTLERLERRRTDLAAEIAADRQRLAAVDARLSLIADESDSAELAFVERALPAVRLFQLADQVENAAEFEDRVGPLFGRLTGTLAARGIGLSVRSYAWYEARGDLMHFAVGYAATSADPGPGVEIAELPAFPRALTAVHHGDVRRIARTWQALAREADARDLQPCGPGREVYHETPMDRLDDWVIEVQLPVARP